MNPYQTIPKTVTLNFYSTPSHGYLQVHKNLVDEVAACNAFKSRFSFYNARLGLFYFEEDYDAPEIMTALKNVGYKINIVDRLDELETIKTYKRLS